MLTCIRLYCMIAQTEWVNCNETLSQCCSHRIIRLIDSVVFWSDRPNSEHCSASKEAGFRPVQCHSLFLRKSSRFSFPEKGMPLHRTSWQKTFFDAVRKLIGLAYKTCMVFKTRDQNWSVNFPLKMCDSDKTYHWILCCSQRIIRRMFPYQKL